MKKVFLAGASGVIGMRVCKLLLQKGYEVYGTTRSEAKASELSKLGVKVVIVDAFDAKNLKAQMVKIKPDIVLHQLTDLPTGLPAELMADALVRNAKLREIGTKNLVDVAIASGAKKMVSQSIGFIYELGATPYTEESALLNFNDPTYGETSRAVASLETQTLNAPFVGIMLRNGLLYGDGTGFDAPIAGVSSVHVDAAANAVVLAIAHDKNDIFNITQKDDTTSSAKAIKVLGWDENFRL